MGKIVTAIGLLSGLVLLFYFGGIIENTPDSALLDMVLNPARFETASLLVKVFSGISIIVGAVSAIVRFGGGVGVQFTLMIPFVTLFINFGWDFLRVYQAMAAFSPIAKAVAILMFGPLMLMYIISIVEWWRGVET